MLYCEETNLVCLRNVGTHDGSLAHILKCERQEWRDVEAAFLSPERVDTIDQLQVRILARDSVIDTGV